VRREGGAHAPSEDAGGVETLQDGACGRRGPAAASTGRLVQRLARLQRTIIACERCPRLRAHCRAVAEARKREFRDDAYWGRPVPSLGDPAARLLIVGLAPAAHGANRTGRMFTGDSSGVWLFRALHRFRFADRPVSSHSRDGLALTDCYITAAAHCAPPDNRPTPEELARCRTHLEAEVAVLRSVRVTLVLGRIAWESWLKAAGWWDRLTPRDRPRFAHGAEAALPDGSTLLCSYHPSRQNTNTGRLTWEMWQAVFARARALLDDAAGLPAG
jgi:uracil-DNA glycosylase family 4